MNVQKNVEVRRWEHNPVHRGTVSYRDPATAQRLLKSGDAPRLDAEKIRRLERREPVALPTDPGTRDALSGDALERRDRIRRLQKEVSPIGVVEDRPDAAEGARRRLGGEPERTEARETVRSRERERQLAAPGAPQATAPRLNGARGRGEAPQQEAGRQQQRIERREAGPVAQPRVEQRQPQSPRQPAFQQSERRSGPPAGGDPRVRETSRETNREAARTGRRAEQAAPPPPVQEQSSRRQAERAQPRSEPRQMPAPQQRKEATYQRQSQPQRTEPRSEPRQMPAPQQRNEATYQRQSQPQRAEPRREQARVTERRQPQQAAPAGGQSRERTAAPAARREAPQARGSGDREKRGRQREDTASAAAN